MPFMDPDAWTVLELTASLIEYDVAREVFVEDDALWAEMVANADEVVVEVLLDGIGKDAPTSG